MAQKIYSFSVSENEAKKVKLVERIKDECKRSGKSFSHVVLDALAKHNKV